MTDTPRDNRKIFKCRHRHCGRVLGQTDGKRLWLWRDGHLEEIKIGDSDSYRVQFNCPNNKFFHLVEWKVEHYKELVKK